VRPPTTGRKILQSIGILGAWASVVGLGTFGTFSDPATPLTGVQDEAPPHRPYPASAPVSVVPPVGSLSLFEVGGDHVPG
jgi:hypothetical protein